MPRSETHHVLAILLGVAILSGCGEDSAGTITLDVPDACNPLGSVSCLMPWPSSAYLAPADTATGVRLDLPAEVMPVNFDGIAIDPAPYNRFDGFSPSGPIFAIFESGVSADGLPPHDDPAASLRDDSATILYDMTSGRRVLHFAEVDANALFPEERALIVRPLERLAPGSRFAVAIRKSVKAEDGSQLPVSPAFAALVARRRRGGGAPAHDPPRVALRGHLRRPRGGGRGSGRFGPGLGLRHRIRRITHPGFAGHAQSGDGNFGQSVAVQRERGGPRTRPRPCVPWSAPIRRPIS